MHAALSTNVGHANGVYKEQTEFREDREFVGGLDAFYWVSYVVCVCFLFVFSLFRTFFLSFLFFVFVFILTYVDRRVSAVAFVLTVSCTKFLFILWCELDLSISYSRKRLSAWLFISFGGTVSPFLPIHEY